MGGGRAGAPVNEGQGAYPPPTQGAYVTPGFRTQIEYEPCTCQDKQFTYTVVT
jgi:hypothetical protein